jgi:hypothetical protein
VAAGKTRGDERFFSKVGAKSTGEWKEEIIFFDPEKTNAVAAAPFFPMEKLPGFSASKIRARFSPTG